MTDPVIFEELRARALELGWEDVGVTQAVIPEADIQAYKQWLADGYQADLGYMENQLRCHPDLFFSGAKSAVLFVSYYKQPQKEFRRDAGLVASYARGRKYHNVHYRRLKKMIRWLEERVGQQGIAKPFSDSAPVLEKALAVRAGLGWFGKNTLLIHRKFGTFILLSGFFTTIELSYAVEEMRLPKCGSCTRCLDACPTGALDEPYRLNASRCLSYHLIESKDPIPAEIQKRNPGYAFGCDICQDVCPHNMRKPLATTAEFGEEAGLGAYVDQSALLAFKENPESLFGSPLQRQGVDGLQRNLDSLELDPDG